jgi:hypothetical protein
MTASELREELERHLAEQVADFIPAYAIVGAAQEVVGLVVASRGEELGPLASFHIDTLTALAKLYARDISRWPSYRRAVMGVRQ